MKMLLGFMVFAFFAAQFLYVFGKSNIGTLLAISGAEFLKELQAKPWEYDSTLVSILAQCIHIIPAGASVDLSTRDKGIVLVENPKNYMEPVILRLSDNTVYDLSDPHISRQIRILDLMKTMDNRIEIDENTLKQFVADERIIQITKKFKKK